MKKHRILIVDDDLTNLDILQDMFEDADDFKIKSVISGEEALESLDIFHPDLILLDIMMPGIDGYEVCRRIRANPKYCYQKIILISGKALLQERLDGYEAGADDYLTKPFEDDELMAKVQVFLKMKRLEEMEHFKSDLLLLISHESRTPLNIINGNTELIMMHYPDDTNIIEFTANINEASNKFLYQIEQATTLLELMNDPKKSPVQFLLNNEIRVILEKFSTHNLEESLEIQIPNGLKLYADRKQFHIALESLLDNAIKYSPSDKQIQLKAQDREKEIVLQVIDRGNGVPTEFIDSIFEAFSIPNIMHHQEGLSLSLAIVDNIMKLHDGSISVENLEQGGSQFELIFPKIEADVV